MTIRSVEPAAVAAAIFLSACVFLPASADPVNVVKLTCVALAAVACVGALGWRVVRSRELDLPFAPPVAAAAGLAGALALAAQLTPSGTTAVLGTPGRLSGLLLYLSAIVLMVSTCTSGLAALWAVRLAVAGAGIFTATYGLLQYLGLDAVNWANEFNPIIAALGNPNFASAYLGVCVPLFAAAASSRGTVTRVRVAAGAGAVVLLGVAALSGASQGPLAAAAGLIVLAVAVSLNVSDAGRRRRWLGVAGAAALLGIATLAAGTTGRGPASPLFGQGSFTTRRWYWDAALSMFRDQPLTGVGLDSYGRFWRTARPVENVAALGGGDFTDAAHSVPLHLLATGGLLVALPYLAFVGATAFVLVRGLLRLHGDKRLRLAGVGGAWVAYQVQSLVSIDQVPLVVLNFVLAGAIVVAAEQNQVKHVRLPGALPPTAKPAKAARPPRVQPRARQVTAADLAGLTAVSLFVLVGAWAVMLPLRADLALRQGELALRQGDGNASLAAFERAADLIPGRSIHWSRRADLLAAVEQVDPALDAYDRALEADPSNIGVLRAAARLAEEHGQLDRARGYHRQATTRDPYNPVTIAAAADFELRHAGAATALALLEDALERIPEPATTPLWVPLGDARQVLGERSGAIEAYQEALRREPSHAKATAELAKLQPR